MAKKTPNEGPVREPSIGSGARRSWIVVAVTGRALRRYPMTWWVTMVTAMVGAAQLLGGEVVADLERNRPLLLAGQWWRLVTPMLVQPSGIGQYAFNLIGSVLAGVAVERQLGAVRWLVIYLGAGFAAVVFSYLAFPAQRGGGSSAAVAGLIGALVITWWVTRCAPWWPGYLFGAFFAAYLTALAVGGVVASTVAGGLTSAVTATLHRHGLAAWLRNVVCLLVGGCSLALTALGDDHGVGLLAGILIGLGLGRARTRWPPGRTRPTAP